MAGADSARSCAISKKRRRVQRGGALPEGMGSADPQLIGRYHDLRKEIAQVDKNPNFPTDATRTARKQALQAQLALIGIDRYQQASLDGERASGNWDSSQWVLGELRQRAATTFAGRARLRVLDVGAIVHRFPDILYDDDARTEQVQLDVTSIDLNPKEDGGRVLQADFFDFAEEHITKGNAEGKDGDDENYDVVCLCLCVNFEGCPNGRGRMLRLASRIVKPGGLVFLVLPRACVDNSRYMTVERLAETLRAVKLPAVSSRLTAKLSLSVAQKGDSLNKDSGRAPLALSKKQVLRQGQQRNNFAICLETPPGWKARKGDQKKAQAPASFATNAANDCTKTGFGKTSKVCKPTRPMSSNQRKKARRQAKRTQRQDNVQ